MELSSHIMEKKSNFRNSIRKKQIDQYFRHLRLKHQIQILNSQRITMASKLTTKEKKRQWLIEISQSFNKENSPQWHHALRELSIAIPLFEQCYQMWVELGLINKIANCLNQQFDSLNISIISSYILQQVFYKLWKYDLNKSWVRGMKIFPNTLRLCYRNKKSESLKVYLQLVNTLLYGREYFFYFLVENDEIQIILSLLKEVNVRAFDQCQLLLTTIYRLVKGLFQRKQLNHCKKLLFALLSILDELLGKEISQVCFKLILKTFAIFGQSERQEILAQMFYSKNLISSVEKIITESDDPFLNSAGANIIASILTSDSLSIVEEIVNRGILDKVRICYSKQYNHLQCLNSLLKILLNIVGTSGDLAERVINHQVFPQSVLVWSKNIDKQNNHEDAIYIISTMIGYRKYQLTDALVVKFGMLGIFVQALQNPALTPSNCMQILRSIITIIETYQQRKAGHENKIVLQLLSVYNLQNILQIVEDQIKNAQVTSCIQDIAQLIFGRY